MQTLQSVLLLVLGFFSHFVQCSVPVLIFSHKLVPKIQNYINNFSHLSFPPERVTEVTHNLIDACSSDAYVFVDHPGVTLDDLSDYSQFKFLRTYSFMSSTLGAMPRVDEPLDYDSLTRYVTSKCGPISTIEIEGFDEVETYIDSGRRLIHIKFPPLPPAEEKELRHEQLMMADKALRNTLRKLPSPSQTVIYSSSIGPQYFNKLHEKRYAKMGIFPDISKDESRKSEFERNDRVKEEEHKLPEKRNNLLKNDELKYQISKFIDSDLILENEWLVIGVAFTAAIFIVKIFLDLLSFLWSLVLGKTEKEKVEEENKKTK